MSKILNSKVTVITSYLTNEPTYAKRVVTCSNNGYKTTDCMLENSKYDTVNLAYDNTTDNNLRYIGEYPNNYVSFNNELWRIVGVMNNIEDINGNNGSMIKLIRNESIGSYSWDNSSSNANYGYGVNEWAEADIMKLLNPGYESETVGGSLYFNQRSGQCHAGENNLIASCDFTGVGLTQTSKEMIEDVIWHTGSNDVTTDKNNITTPKFYEFERSSNTGKTCTSGIYCTDTVERTTTWLGKVGLFSPSDYGYATSGGTKTSRDTCLNAVLYNWSDSNLSDCSANNWINKVSTKQWSINPSARSDRNAGAFFLYTPGIIRGNGTVHSALDIVPSIYLKTNIKFTKGNGDINDPYQLSV